MLIFLIALVALLFGVPFFLMRIVSSNKDKAKLARFFGWMYMSHGMCLLVMTILAILLIPMMDTNFVGKIISTLLGVTLFGLLVVIVSDVYFKLAQKFSIS